MTAIRAGRERDQRSITDESIPTATARQALSRTPAPPRLFLIVPGAGGAIDRFGSTPARRPPEKRTLGKDAAMIMEIRLSASDQIELLQLSQRHGFNPSVLRFARFGEAF